MGGWLYQKTALLVPLECRKLGETFSSLALPPMDWNRCHTATKDTNTDTCGLRGAFSKWQRVLLTSQTYADTFKPMPHNNTPVNCVRQIFTFMLYSNCSPILCALRFTFVSKLLIFLLRNVLVIFKIVNNFPEKRNIHMFKIGKTLPNMRYIYLHAMFQAFQVLARYTTEQSLKKVYTFLSNSCSCSPWLFFIVPIPCSKIKTFKRNVTLMFGAFTGSCLISSCVVTNFGIETASA